MKLPKKKTCILLLCAVLAFGVFLQFMMSSNLLYVREVIFPTEKISNPVDIVLISDLHEKEFGPGNERLFEEINKLSPDLIAITGDLISDTYSFSTETENYIYNVAARANAIAPTYFVTGNHEMVYSEPVKKALQTNHVNILEDSIVTVDVAGNTFSIGGIDDASMMNGVVAVLPLSHMPGFRLMLAHNPEPFYKEYAQSGADLVLSGHTHGGQVRLPLGAAVRTQEGWFPKFTDGIYKNGDMTMAVTPGLGTSGAPPFRMFVRPEITLVRLVPA